LRTTSGGFFASIISAVLRGFIGHFKVWYYWVSPLQLNTKHIYSCNGRVYIANTVFPQQQFWVFSCS
jgi:hypothetical protein